MRTASAFYGRALSVLVVAVAMALGALFVPAPWMAAVLYGAASTLAALVALMRGIRAFGGRASRGPAALAEAFCANDTAPAFSCDSEGQVFYRNAAAQKRFGHGPDQTLVRALGELFANPTAVIYRLQARAEAQGAAQEDVVTRRGHIRVAVHRFAGQSYFWRFDELEERGGGRGAEGLSLPMMTVGRRDTILFMNEAARRVLGGRVKTLHDVLGNGPINSDSIVELHGSDGAVRARVVTFDGRIGRREIYFLPVQDETDLGHIDAQFFDALPVALLKLAPDGAVAMANRAARDLLGAPRGAMNLCERVEGLGRSMKDWLTEVAAGRVSNHSEVLRVSRDDREVFLQITLERIVDGQEAGLVAVLHDATELKTLEAQFVQSQKMQAIGQLAGGVAHDFNNLLTAISGHCDLLMLRHDHGDPDYGDLVQIHQNANRAASLIGQLLAFSRKQTLRPEVLDLHDILTDLTHLLNRLVGERVSLSVSHDPNLGAIRADKRQLEQVIMNLVVNARDALPEGGEIRIETAMHHLQDPLRRDRAVVPRGTYVLIRVTDEGVGIAPDKLEKIFEPFFTTKGVGEGTGLGLSTVYGIVKQTGGYIFVDSVVGAGTSFTLYLPAYEHSISKQPQAELEPAAPMPLLLSDPVVPEVGDPAPQTATPEVEIETPEAVEEEPLAEPELPGIVEALQKAIDESDVPTTCPEEAEVLKAEAPVVVADEAVVAAAPTAEGPVTVAREAPRFGWDIVIRDSGHVAENLDARRSTVAGTPPYLPARGLQDVTKMAGPAPTMPPLRQGEGVVLLVEDEAPVRAFASRALRMRGYTVLEAGNAEEALETLKDGRIVVDVFVTDVVMPGMDGPSWVRQALQQRPETRVVFVSGYAEDSFADTQAEIPNSVFLPKPFSLTELTTTVHDQLR